MAEVFVKDFRENPQLRNSFNELAYKTFGIEFETWYQHGYWTDKYIPYSFVENGKIIANVSVNLIDLVMNNEILQAIQIGTVMTHSDYRNRGLSRRLMEMVLEDFQHVDLLYLFANQSVLEFYPKFGFKAFEEAQFSMEYDHRSILTQGIKKLDKGNSADLNFVYQFTKNRVPASNVFSTINTAELVMFYFLMVFPEHFYYLEDEQALVIYRIEHDVLHLFDFISHEHVDVKKVLGKIARNDTSKVIFHYHPEDCGENISKVPYQSNLFIKNITHKLLPNEFKHPLTSQA